MKKIIALVLVIALCCSVSVGLTLAYLTDRDSKANVFTVGDVEIELEEDFEQGAELIPGVDINKDVQIKNTGKNDAWVWYTYAIPASLDTAADASSNILHTNHAGANWLGYQNNRNYWAEGQTEATPEDQCWIVDYNPEKDAGNPVGTMEQDDITYNVYAVLYNGPLAPNELTTVGLTNVYLDANVDIDPNGDWYHVEGGKVEGPVWNTEKGNPVIYVSAYAIQTDGFDTVQEAYAAYAAQWGENGTEWGTPATVTEISDDAELAAAIKNKTNEPVVLKLADGEYTTNIKIEGGRDITITGDEGAVLSGQIATTSSTAGTLTLKGVTVNVDDTIDDSTGISQTSKSAIAIWGNQTVICEDVTFNMSLADSTAITSWWDTNEGTSIIVKNCTFNCKGQRPIRATGNVTVENSTFNDPYRYAVQLTAKTDTATLMDKAIINFNNNTIVNGENGKNFVYGIQLEGADYGCHDCVINGSGNKIVDGGTDSAMYYCECVKVDHDTITWNTEVEAVHEES